MRIVGGFGARIVGGFGVRIVGGFGARIAGGFVVKIFGGFGVRIVGGFGMLIFGGFGMLIVGGFLSSAGGLSTTSAKPDTTKHNPKINSEVSFFILSSTEKLTGRTFVFKPD